MHISLRSHMKAAVLPDQRVQPCMSLFHLGIGCSSECAELLQPRGPCLTSSALIMKRQATPVDWPLVGTSVVPRPSPASCTLPCCLPQGPPNNLSNAASSGTAQFRAMCRAWAAS